MSGKREFGDYQTPIDFADRVCAYVRNKKNIRPDIIIEPTCGKGSFIQSSLAFGAEKIIGIEINPEYCELCRNIKDKSIEIHNTDFFAFNLNAYAHTGKKVLIIGNPPWVTNSTLSSLNSDNLPHKVNFKGLSGMDAMTGASNFDICEYMILQIINAFKETDATIAMLCKTSVARNLFSELRREQIHFSDCELLEFDASKVFGISASACVFYLQLSKEPMRSDTCRVLDFDNDEREKSVFGYVEGNFYSSVSSEKRIDFDGECEFEWRQGVKHDCSKVMELKACDNKLMNGFKENIDIEDTLVFPLIKSSMFKAPIIESFSRYVIVTQHKVGEDTSFISDIAPKTWRYLNDNIESFEGRKSSIYNGAPTFSMFGVGDYSYERYKVGVSGFYKEPLFSVLYSENGKPVMTDDTSYFICFDNYYLAYVAMLILNSKDVRAFLKSVAFLDAKRPYTKKVLRRISFSKILDSVDYEQLKETERDLQLGSLLSEDMLLDFKDYVMENQDSQQRLPV